MLEIIWNKNIEPQNKAEIEKYLIRWLALVPAWCQQIYVNLLGNSEDNAAAQITVNHEYRNAHLDFFCAWLAETESTKNINIIHELIHCSINPLFFHARRIIKDAVTDNDQLRDYVLNELSITNEAVTQDLARAIYDGSERGANRGDTPPDGGIKL